MDDNTFECPQCGARIYPEITRCPQCGQNMYPEDEEAETGGERAGSLNRGASLGGIVTGWLVAGGSAVIIHFIVGSLATPITLGTGTRLILLLAGPIGALAGGYVGAGLTRRNSALIGGLVGVLCLPISALLATHWVKVTPNLLLSSVILGEAALIILAGVAGGWLNRKFTQDVDWQEKWKVRGWEDLLYQDLLRKVRFNGSIADRLIDYERKQEPQASRLKLIQNAIERWERDNR